MPEDTVKRNKRQYNWMKENTDRMNLVFEKGTKDRVQRASAKTGMSASKYVQMAIEKQLEKDKE